MKVLILSNIGMGLYKFRKELIEELIKEKHDVNISLPKDEYVDKFRKLGCKIIDTPLERRGTNPLKDLRLLFNYIKILKQINPDIVLTYTIKPNVYGGIACTFTNTPYIVNVTGLGTSIESGGIIQKLTLMLYKIGLKKASCIFFQNKSNQQFFLEKGIIKGNYRLIPGSGVNLDKHKFEDYPEEKNKIRFLFIGRIMKAKGIEELLKAAEIIKEKYPDVQFDIIGPIEEDYEQKLKDLNTKGIINYLGRQDDVHSFIKKSHATILPSYHEGLSNVLLESASTGRPVLASRVPGCMETFDEGISGYGFEARNVESLVKTIIKFINLPYEQKIRMGINGRRKIEKEFDRKIVIDAYLEEINKTVNKEK